MKSTNIIEEGFVTFVGVSQMDVTLQKAKNPASIMTNIVELPDTYNTGSSYTTPAAKNADTPSRYYGTIQVAAYWLSDTQFRITTSAPYYGDVRWIVTS